MGQRRGHQPKIWSPPQGHDSLTRVVSGRSLPSRAEDGRPYRPFFLGVHPSKASQQSEQFSAASLPDATMEAYRSRFGPGARLWPARFDITILGAEEVGPHRIRHWLFKMAPAAARERRSSTTLLLEP